MKSLIAPKQLRSFGLMVGGIFSLAALWPLLVRGEPVRWWSAVVAGLLAIPALLRPASLGPIYRLWMLVGEWLGWLNTRVILAIGFFGLVTPIAIVRRVLGKDSLHREFKADMNSYRVVRVKRPGSHMFHQY